LAEFSNPSFNHVFESKPGHPCHEWRIALGRIAVVGSIMTDLITYVTRMPERGETLEAPSFTTAPGGKGANQAVAAALMGSDVTMIACVGDDAFGDAARANLQRRGVDARHVRVVPGATSGIAPIFVEPSGENRILIVRGANDELAPADVAAADAAIAACDVLVLQLEVPLETVYAAIATGVRHGRRIVLNPAPANADLDLARLDGVAYVVPNQSELALLTARPVATRDDAIAAARVLIERGIACVIVTLGADGALVVDARTTRHVRGIAVDAVDTTGAGDAFIGSFVDRIGSGASLDAALDAAVRYAALSVTRRGTQTSFPTRTEFDAFRPPAGAAR
jgi:ribokinase